ncbi:glycosyltransferase family 2 protein [Porticoccaceae bacterium]|nr:glycosyltransferase family 2 protein [Porticoccaceae bacterium]
MYAPVSVIIPCFECRDTIARAIESVDNQTVRPIEVILIDDCSGDSTLEFLYELKDSYPEGWLKIFPLPENSGPGTARNKGWDLASQEYIAFLDSDDSWHPSKIEIQYLWMSKNSTVVMTAHASKEYEEPCDYSGNITDFKKVSSFQMLLRNEIPCRSVMMKRMVDLRFLDGKRYAEDYLLWMRVIYKYSSVYLLNKTLSFSYKSEFDATGLTGQLYCMHSGVLHMYKELYYDKRISLPVLLFLNFISYVKLGLRFIKKYLLGLS